MQTDKVKYEDNHIIMAAKNDKEENTKRRCKTRSFIVPTNAAFWIYKAGYKRRSHLTDTQA